MTSVTAATISTTSGVPPASCRPDLDASQNQQTATRNKSKRTSTREKIEKLVAEGANNYPSYLKLIYTGDSEEPSSSDDEFSAAAVRSRTGRNQYRGTGRTGSGDVVEAVREDRFHAGQKESTKLCESGREKSCVTLTSSASTRQELPRHVVCPTESQMNDANIRTTSSLNGHTRSHSLPADDSSETVLRQELVKIQGDIASLKALLNSKLSEAAALRQKLGLTTMAEIRHDLQNGLRNIKQSGTFQKTNAAFRSLGAYASKKMGDLRQSMTFKSVEDKVGALRTSRSMGSIRSRLTLMTTSRSENDVATVTTTPGVDHSLDGIDEDHVHSREDEFSKDDNPYTDS